MQSLSAKAAEDKEGAGVNLQGNPDPKGKAIANATNTQPIEPIETSRHSYSRHQEPKLHCNSSQLR